MSTLPRVGASGAASERAPAARGTLTSQGSPTESPGRPQDVQPEVHDATPDHPLRASA